MPKSIDCIDDPSANNAQRDKTLFYANSTIGLIIDPITQQIVDCNKSAQNFYGYTRKKLLNMKISDINTMSSDAIQAEMKDAKEHKKNMFHFKHRLHDGTVRDVEVYSSPITLEEKEYLYSIVIDITQRVELQKREQFLQERLSFAMEGSNDGLWDWNIQTNEIFFSPRWKEILGYKDEELKNELSVWEELVHPDDRKLSWIEFERFIASQNPQDRFSINFRMLHKDGHYVPILSRAKKVFSSQNEAERLVGTHVDMTELMQSRDKLKLLLESLSVGVIVHAPDTSVIMHNPKANEILGLSTEQLQGVKAIDPQWHFIDGDRNILSPAQYPVNKIIATKEKISNLLIGIKHPDNSKTTWVYVNGFPVLNNKNEIVEVIINFIDITELLSSQDELKDQKNILEYQAHHDALTGLPNRILFNDRLEQAIVNAKRNKTKIALLFIDLDHFKEINDSLGHSFGDDILKIVSKRLLEATRDNDSIARLGGDEFTVILEELTQVQDASLIANKIIDALSQAIVVDEKTFYVSCSIGVSIYPDDGVTSENLLKYADSAMYKAKDEGRNNFQYYSAHMTELAFERVVMEASLREAIKKEQFIVYYQPQVNGATDMLIGLEALVRWQHPSMGLVSPAKFIPLAESTGLIVELDRYMMRTAMTQLSKWYKGGYNPGVLAMNLAIKQLKQKDFIQMLQNLIKETECKPEWLELEVTESQIMTNPDEAVKVLKQISSMGIELAIDDFGTGYSSLAYLKKLPINKLKIDQAFARGLPHNEEDVGIAKAVIALAQSLNLKIIAEGVETKEQKDFLVANGCENIQGYFYSKPIPALEIEKMLPLMPIPN